MNQHEDDWEKFLNPTTLRENLIGASLFITAYEMLKDAIIEQLKSFYVDPFDDGSGYKNYEREVLSLDAKRAVFRASVEWLKKDGVINIADADLISDLSQHRNDLAHNLPQFLAERKRNIELSRVSDIVSLVSKIDRWWIINFELAIRDDIDHSSIDENRIVSGRMMFLQMLFQTASSDESSELYRQFLLQRAKLQKRPST